MTSPFINDLFKLKQWLSIKHHIPGRIRLKFCFSILTKAMYFNKFKDDIQKSPLIKNYQLNLATGSLLVEYDETIIPSYLLDQLLMDDEIKSQKAFQTLTTILSQYHDLT